jgi:hypothetical protein
MKDPNKYILGTMAFPKEWLKPFSEMEKEAVLSDIVNQTIPIYTIKHPNPKSNRPDCNITKREKERFRILMKAKLSMTKTEQEIQKVIDHYKQLFSEQK